MDIEIYQVKIKDKIEKLSEHFKLPASVLLSFNKLKEISEGDMLVIPKLSGKIYKVLPFESLDQIAEKFNVSSKEIQEKNNIDKVYPFMEILI